MLCVIPFDNAYAPAAHRLLKWCYELSGRVSHGCLLVVSRNTTDSIIQESVRLANEAFCSVSVVKPKVDDLHKWPDTPNLLWRTAAKYIAAQPKTAWFWCEVDCVPLVSDWLDKLELEYTTVGKPYMGHRRDVPIPHITGIAVYPPNVAMFNPASLEHRVNRHGVLPFDVIQGDVTLKHAHHTDLIQHVWAIDGKPATFPDQQSLDLIRTDAVLFHRVKDASLIQRLRERKALEPKAQSKSVLNKFIASMKSLVGSELGNKEGNNPTASLVYIHVPGDFEHVRMARNFVDSYKKFPPLYPHNTIVVLQRTKPGTQVESSLFSGLPNLSYFEHDDSGWDIGAYLAAAKSIKDEIMVCFGGSTFFRKSGWLLRMVDAWKKHGPGFYGSNACHDIRPHINTNGFWTAPSILRKYPHKVVSRVDRYEFEHGKNAMWRVAATSGFPVKLVTWCGEYDWQEWRKAPNIFKRGDQSNCLSYWHHHIKYERSTPKMKQAYSRGSDNLCDPEFMKPPTVKMVYIYPPEEKDSKDLASRFVRSYFAHPPGFKHETVVVCNGGKPDKFIKDLFRDIPCKFFVHDDSGWDIGAYLALANSGVKSEAMVCMGGPATIKCAGWLEKLVSAWMKYGRGIYGSFGSLQYGVPHIPTSGFICPTALLKQYPVKVVSYEERAEFEHGKGCLTNLAKRLRMETRMVTRNGVWQIEECRKPENVLNKGDQSNLLTGYRQTDIYDNTTPQQKKIMQARVDGRMK